MIKLSYRIIRFTKAAGFQYVGMAWNYDHAIFVTTDAHPTYTVARDELTYAVQQWSARDGREATPYYFDGEYTCAGEGHQLEPIKD